LINLCRLNTAGVIFFKPLFRRTFFMKRLHEPVVMADISSVVNPLRWNLKRLLWVLLAGALLWFLFFDTYSVWSRLQYAQERKTLEEDIERLSVQLQTLEDQIEQLESDPDLLERIAREDYGMKKPGEVIYRTEKTPPSSPDNPNQKPRNP
jgi:cell division protein FtsB